ncbi:Phenazine biosynthesis protein PhzF like [Richelia intracellularis HM01]|uniref:PhzF family phenazine biosynthesis protein n=1 Tax=Richelia intracellularis TaxID=1164990 RepID=UPI0002B5839E|nr:PhzF family phenazine biosynthesis protein [Richelia intracellularis]CCH66053.1 Phenazine biosynthesis protein PhzF like [Richelia intracellularis HM01]
MNNHYYIVDVFADNKYAGNPLAVFTNSANIDTQEMQSIAKEINYSETTFITSPQKNNGGYEVRIFTPNREIPFAGHPTLGTAYIIQQIIIQKPVEKIILNLEEGQIPVTINYKNSLPEWLWMRQQAPYFGSKLPGSVIAEVLRLNPSDIDLRWPIQEVSTGLPFIIVPLKNISALQQISLNVDKYYQLIAETEAKCILVFSPETYYPENNLHVRVFCHYMGMLEDPATGSANGCLAGYLTQYTYFGDENINIRVEQGYEIGRPSLLLLKASRNDVCIDINIGGKVILVAKGEFLVPAK